MFPMRAPRFVIRQRYANDCGIAVAAMVSGRSYDVVRAAASQAGVFHPSGTSIARMTTILELCSGVEWTARRPVEIRPVVEHPDLVFAPGPMALLIGDPDHDNSHWIGLQDTYLCDPAERSRFQLFKYPRRGWELRRILESAF